ncbi:MAG: NAD(P)(+) transhydrogenase (Re/Si-specific) subunit alpha, partial [Pseudomonadales bacterium]|nr:NAD(P)(+) transhydrogenase (Re/Si-specific) subunit alpha [Pseudomonadales bacterium]
MLIGVPKETWQGELRAALVPQNAKKLIGAGFEVAVEAGAGIASGYRDEDYAEAGAAIESDRTRLLSSADILLRVRKPDLAEVSQLKTGAVHISFLDPFNEKGLVDALAARGVTAISMEMIPRTTRAQKMDALSSQANLAGYVTVILAATQSPKIFPMMMTP